MFDPSPSPGHPPSGAEPAASVGAPLPRRVLQGTSPAAGSPAGGAFADWSERVLGGVPYRPKEPSRPAAGARASDRRAAGVGPAAPGCDDALPALDIVPPDLLEPPPERESIGSFDEDWALLLDRWLRRLAKREGLCRLVMGRLAQPLLERKGYRRLGFARLGDYARERLGISARQMQSMAAVASRLRVLPATEAALTAGELSWSKARVLVRVATPESEGEWIARARAMTVRALEGRIASECRPAPSRRPGQGAAPDGAGASCADLAGGPPPGVVAGVEAGLAAQPAADGSDDGSGEAAAGSCVHAPASGTTGACAGPSWHGGAAGGPPAATGVAPRALQAAVDPDDEGRIDGEAPAEVRIACPRYVRSAWRMAVELASRMSGGPLPQWRAAETIAAEALAGAPVGPGAACNDKEGVASDAGAYALLVRSIVGRPGSRLQERSVPFDPTPDPFDAIAHAEHPMVASTAQRAFPWLEWNAVSGVLPDEVASLAEGAEHLDPFALDTRIRLAQSAMQRLDFQLGRLLRTLAGRRLHQAMGFRTLARYVSERLGVSSRKASMLMSIERRSWQTSTELTEALREGSITPLKAAALLPVLSEWTAQAWIERARTVTLRRLLDEVGWALDKRDFKGSLLPLAPPPAGAALADLQSALRAALAKARGGGLRSEEGQPIHALRAASQGQTTGDAQAAGDSQMCARSGDGIRAGMDGAEDDRLPRPALLSPSLQTTEPIVSSEIRFRGPQSVAVLFADAIAAWSRPGQAPWNGLWRVLVHVLEQWSAQPRHRDPVFERDGWRCAVPGCSSRRNLQDHHLLFRSRGGDNSRDNRITLCLWHHLHGIHDGIVSAHGRAPDDVHWKLGVRGNGRALLELHGETYAA